ncbi:MAG: hypothetical protein J4F42_18710 [Desulfurellaceae bacterium]|nr:hypothetical protein [Desulfurellaceae bacterium]
MYRQYDSLVSGNTVVQPGSDAAVLRIKDTTTGIGLSVDCNSRYCAQDPYRGALIAVAESARNLAVSGARPLAVSDCLNFGNPEKPEVMWQFQQAIAGMRDACQALGLAVVSGNVSFYNETEGRAIPPTPTVAMVGLLTDVGRRMTQWFKRPGDVIVLVGESLEELGASEYLAVMHDRVAGRPPQLNLEREKRLHQLCLDASAEDLLSSAHDVAEGGLAVALAEACISGPTALGAQVHLAGTGRPDAQLFGESQSRVLVSLAEAKLARLQTLAEAAELPCSVLGRVGGSVLELQVDAAEQSSEMTAASPPAGGIRLPVTRLAHEWRTALARQLGL